MTNTGDALLIKRAKDLLAEMGEFTAVRDETGPSLASGGDAESWRARTDALIRHGSEFQSTYAAEYAGRVLAVVDAFAERGIKPRDKDSVDFRHPTNPLGLQAVMAELGYLVERLQMRDSG